jgi:hypothetical protein
MKRSKDYIKTVLLSALGIFAATSCCIIPYLSAALGFLGLSFLVPYLSSLRTPALFIFIFVGLFFLFKKYRESK